MERFYYVNVRIGVAVEHELDEAPVAAELRSWIFDVLQAGEGDLEVWNDEGESVVLPCALHSVEELPEEEE